MQIPWDLTSTILYRKEDINKGCKFCQRDVTKKVSYGYDCMIKWGKRKMNRCKKCYFGIHC